VVRAPIVQDIFRNLLPRHLALCEIAALGKSSDGFLEEADLRMSAFTSLPEGEGGGGLTSLSFHSGLRTLAALCFVRVRNRPLSVDSASVNFPFLRISLYDMPASFDWTRKSSFASRTWDAFAAVLEDSNSLLQFCCAGSMGFGSMRLWIVDGAVSDDVKFVEGDPLFFCLVLPPEAAVSLAGRSRGDLLDPDVSELTCRFCLESGKICRGLLCGSRAAGLAGLEQSDPSSSLHALESVSEICKPDPGLDSDIDRGVVSRFKDNTSGEMVLDVRLAWGDQEFDVLVPIFHESLRSSCIC